VNQSQRFGKLGVEFQGCGNRARHLRNLNRMGEAIAEMIGETSGENLRFSFEPPERP
jgi:hypothetical protein